jgi:hypothetical protein
MGLTNWKGSVVRKQDIYIAKNYLNEDEIDTLNRLVVIFLETAELRAKNRQLTKMNFWKENAEQIIQNNDFSLLKGAGNISHPQMKKTTSDVYIEFDIQRKQHDAELADKEDDKELAELENKVKKRITGENS